MSGEALGALLKSYSRSTAIVDMPNPMFGELRLDVDNAIEFLTRHPEGNMTDEMLADANRQFQAGRALFDPANPSVSLEAMRSITKQYPLWAGGHGAMFEGQQHQGNTEEALYHLSQLVVVQPTYDNFALFGQKLGQAGKLEESCIVLEFLFTIPEAAVTPDDELSVTKDLLVTLTRLQKGDRMVEVVNEATTRHGFIVELEYQAILGHILSGTNDAAKARLGILSPKVKPTDPLFGKLQKMKQILGLD